MSYIPSHITLLRSTLALGWGLKHTVHWKKEQSCCWPYFLKEYTAFPVCTQDGEREKPLWLLVNSVESMWRSCREQESHVDLGDRSMQALSVPGPASACRGLPQLLTSRCLAMSHFPQPHRTDKTLSEAAKRVLVHFPFFLGCPSSSAPSSSIGDRNVKAINSSRGCQVLRGV